MTALNNAFVPNGAMPRNAARHPLVKTGRVSPLMLQPLFKEIDELEYGGKKLSSSGVKADLDGSIAELLCAFLTILVLRI